MKRLLTLGTVFVLLSFAQAALANPSPGFDYYLFSVYWFIKTAPFNYAVDLIALFLALLVTGQQISIAWRLVPIYNVLVFICGYLADYLARAVLNLPVMYVPSSKEHLMGKLAAESGYDSSAVALPKAYVFLAVAAVLLFAFNSLIIYAILRWNDAWSYRRLPLSAAIVAVVTAPYFGLKKDALIACLVPILMFAAVAAIYFAVRKIVSMRILKKPALRR